MVVIDRSAILRSGPRHHVGERNGDPSQEATTMEPNFILPTMSSYFANRRRDPRSARETALAPAVSPAPRQSMVSRARLASGALIISLGERVAGAPPLAYNVPADDTAGITS
jgi:hypothetical protein